MRPPSKPQVTLRAWLMSVRLYRVAIFLLFLSLLSLLSLQYYVYHMTSDSGHLVYRSRNQLAHEDDPDAMHSSQLERMVEELKRVKASVNNELRTLESKRQTLQTEVIGYQTQIDVLKMEFDHHNRELQQVKMHVDQAHIAKQEVELRNIPDIQAPLRILATNDHTTHTPLLSWKRCTMQTCFDYSRCSLLSGFPVYFYDPTIYSKTIGIVNAFIETSIINAFGRSAYVTDSPLTACVYVVVVGELIDERINFSHIEKSLFNLPFWRGDGRNHVLINLSRTSANGDILSMVNTGLAIVAQSSFSSADFRDNFDMVIPPSLGLADGYVWDQLPPLSPVHRKYLLTFQGDYTPIKTNNNEFVIKQNDPVNFMPNKPETKEYNDSASIEREGDFLKEMEIFKNDVAYKKRQLLQSNYESQEKDIVDALKHISQTTEDHFYFEFSCQSNKKSGLPGEWRVCENAENRAELLKSSTFSLIILPTNQSLVTTTLTQTRIYESIKYGAVPIILGDFIEYPFSSLLDWSKCIITIPKARITELHFFIRTLTDATISGLRRQCRLFYETYISTTKSIIDTLLSTIRVRLQIPASPTYNEPSPSFYNETYPPLTFPVHNLDPDNNGDILGPVEEPYMSPKYLDNFTVDLTYFNHPGDPFHSYPHRPNLAVLPAEAQFLGSGMGFRPVNKGQGGSGKEFSEALGGNVPKEQFTIVMLTYKREVVLINALQRLKGLPHLNSVVVVWNSPNPPYVAFRWPEIGVPIHVIKGKGNSLNNRFLPYDIIDTEAIVIKGKGNSLNNRFLPYDIIDTEAILSVDDDAHLRHDEIIFGFRIWRENRDRIVGFPARYHTWDIKHKSWLYNSNYTCELSMVLTGAAFFHKYYAYIYSYIMPPMIREKVDEYMNCEDIAMNFLVSHITRKPPIKVTSRWTFRCPGCNDALSIDDSHFHERHKCINFFVQVYGYMPLMYTQFRADSVLFKTRISHDKQKCFKFL